MQSTRYGKRRRTRVRGITSRPSCALPTSLNPVSRNSPSSSQTCSGRTTYIRAMPLTCWPIYMPKKKVTKNKQRRRWICWPRDSIPSEPTTGTTAKAYLKYPRLRHKKYLQARYVAASREKGGLTRSRESRVLFLCCTMHGYPTAARTTVNWGLHLLSANTR